MGHLTWSNSEQLVCVYNILGFQEEGLSWSPVSSPLVLCVSVTLFLTMDPICGRMEQAVVSPEGTKIPLESLD